MRPFTQASLHRTAHLPSGPALPLQTLPRPSYTATKSPGTLKPAHVAAAAPAAAAPGSLIIRVATGVPLIEFFQSMTVAQAGVRAAMIIGATCALILLLNRLIVVLGDKLSKAVDPANTPEDNVVTELLSDAIKASERPVCVLLPLLGAAFCSTVLAAFGEVALERVTMGDSMAKFGGLSVDVLRNAAQLLQDTSEIVFIAFT